MDERVLTESLDQAVEAMLARIEPVATTNVVSALLRIADQLRRSPKESFRRSLRVELMEQALREPPRQPPAPAWVPEGRHAVTPDLRVPSSARIMEFLKEAFGAEELLRQLRPNGVIAHAEVRIGDSVLHVAEDPIAQWRVGPSSFRTYVEDVDETYRQALAAGAVSSTDPFDTDYGERGAAITDPAGNYWHIARDRTRYYKYPGLQDVAPYLFPRQSHDYVDFLRRAFGAVVLGRHDLPDGTVAHASLQIGDSVIGVSEPYGAVVPMPGALYLYVEDVDDSYRRAVQAGAKPVSEPEDQHYGDRLAVVSDSMGNQWLMAHRLQRGVRNRSVPVVADPSSEELLSTHATIKTTIAPMLSVRRGAEAVEFYKSAFGAVEVFRIESPDGAVVSRLSIDGAEFWVADESPEHANFSPESLGGGTIRLVLTVADPDALFATAIAAGAKQVWAVGNQYGWRLGRLVDPYGHHWEIGHELAAEQD